MYVAILAGGRGTRLWPRSRQDLPKQFADIAGRGQTMIQETVARLEGLIEDDHIYVLTGSAYLGLAREQLPQLPTANFLVEPQGRNTGPAIGLACTHLHHRDPDAVVAFLPADHLIQDAVSLRKALALAEEMAQRNQIVTLGIEPTLPHTGYGYIRQGQLLHHHEDTDQPVYAVDTFLEKPDLPTAQQLVVDGRHYWNGGMFISRADQLLKEIERQLPDVHDCLSEIRRGLDSQESAEVLAATWAHMPSISIDFGVMEGANDVAVIPLRAGWSDIGSWDALGDVLAQDQCGNSTAKGELFPIDSEDNVVYSDRTFVSLIGVRDLVVVDSGNALLIGHRDKMQNVSTVVEYLHSHGRTELI
jgi:mannose-1-phosphate guanylyltransferase